MILKPLVTYGCTPETALKRVLTKSADPKVTTDRSYQYLVTELNVSPAQADRLLKR